MADFETLKNNASTAGKEILANKNKETKATLEKSFIDAMKSWDNAIIAKETEAKADTTKLNEATTARSEFDTFKNALEQELKDILTTKENETQLNEKETQKETNILKDIITDQAYNLLLTYKNKTRIDIKNEQEFKEYINAFQIIITVLGASTHLGDTKENNQNIDNLGPITQAGVRTLQKYLNTTYMVGLEVDGKPGPKTLEALLSPVSDTETTTRLEKMFADKTAGKLNLVPEKVIITTPRKIKTETARKRSNTTPTDKLNNEPAIPLTPEEQLQQEKEKKFEEKKKAILISIKKIAGLEKSTDLKSLGITFNEKNETIFGQSGLTRVDEDKQDDFTVKLKEGYKVESGKIIKKIKVTLESLDKNNAKGILKTQVENIKANLKNELNIEFTGSDKDINTKYYETNIKGKSITVNTNNIDTITIMINNNTVVIPAKDIINKDLSTNYDQINVKISNYIIDMTKKQIEFQKTAEVQKKYNILRQYFQPGSYTRKSFGINSLYKPEEQTDMVKSYFNNIDGFLREKRNHEIHFINKGQKGENIQLEMDYSGDNEMMKGLLFTFKIEKYIGKDGILNEILLKNDLKQQVNKNIKKAFPNYIPTTNNVPNNQKEEAKQKTIDTKKSTTKVNNDNINTKGA